MLLNRGRRGSSRAIAMKIVSVLVATAMFVLGLGAIAHAAELFGGPFFPPAGGHLLCSVVNVSDKAITVRTEVFNGQGVVLHAVQPTWDPGEGGGLIGFGGRYCKFSGQFNKNSVRANAAVVDADGVTTAVLEAR